MNRAAVLLLGLALLGDAPLPSALVAGTIRDQNGQTVNDARISLYAGGKDIATVVSAPDGTFAAPGVSADAVKIECDFCQPLRLNVPSDGIIVVIVRRYDALRNQVPAADDLAHLPYAYGESALSLSPFVVLHESLYPFPGTRLSDRRVSSSGGLVILNGVPDYDIQDNISPFLTIPERDPSSVDVHRTNEAYLYGDTANAGTFIVQTPGGGSLGQVGGGAAARLATTSGNIQTSAAYSSDIGGDDRTRADANLSFPIPGATIGATIGAGGANILPAAGNDLGSAFSSARLSFQRTSGLDYSASFTADRGTYYYDELKTPVSATWSDVDARAEVRSHAVVAPFALVDFRRSTAESTLGQTRGEIGVQFADPHVQVLAATGADTVSYGGLNYAGGSQQTVHDGTASVTWTPGSTLSIEASWTHGYYLPTFTQTYGPPAPSRFYTGKNDTIESTLTLSDARRVRVGLTALRYVDDAGDTSGSAGASLAWQLAPRLSLRTWVLRVADSPQGPASFGSTWITYDWGKIRIDAILRRDLLNSSPDAHIDGSISGTLSRGFTWFLSTEQRYGVRSANAGLRW